MAHAKKPSGDRTHDIPISGMHCASCAIKIAKTLKGISGVKDASVNFATERARVIASPAVSEETLAQAIFKLGYKVPALDRERAERESDVRTTRNLFLLGLVLSIPIFVLSFPEWFGITVPAHNYVLFALTLPVQFVVGWRFYVSALAALRSFSANMDTLIAIGTTAAFAYSAAATFRPDIFGMAMYYDTAAIIITFIMLGKWLEALAKGRASEAIKKLIG